MPQCSTSGLGPQPFPVPADCQWKLRFSLGRGDSCPNCSRQALVCIGLVLSHREDLVSGIWCTLCHGPSVVPALWTVCVCVVNQKITISQSSLIFVKCLWGKKKHKTISLLYTRLWVIKFHWGLDEKEMGWSLKRTEGSPPQAPRDSLSYPESSGKRQCCILGSSLADA